MIIDSILNRLSKSLPSFAVISALLFVIILTLKGEMVSLEENIWFLIIIQPFWCFYYHLVERSNGLIDNVKLIWTSLPLLALFAISSSDWDWIWRLSVLGVNILLMILSNYIKFPKIKLSDLLTIPIILLPLLPLLFMYNIESFWLFLIIFVLNFILLKFLHDELHNIEYKFNILKLNRIRIAWLLSIIVAVLLFANGYYFTGIVSLLPFIYAYYIKKIKIKVDILSWFLYSYLILSLTVLFFEICFRQSDLLQWHYVGYLITVFVFLGIISFIGNWNFIKKNYL